MLIANPIYDSVFKYLLEDLEIAKGLISLILEEEITELSFQPQETSVEGRIGAQLVTIYRLDFKAVIKNPDGSHKKILIELQKSKRFANIKRFRGYLAENYRKEELITLPSGKQAERALPIITIYFLGFRLNEIEIPVLKVSKCFYDVVKTAPIKSSISEPFIDLLTHEAYMVQIPLLSENDKSRVEKVLNIFSQRYIFDDGRRLDFKGQIDDPLLKLMTDRLNRAIADEKLRKEMDMENEIDETFDRELGEVYEEVIEERKKNIEKTKIIEEKEKTIEEKDKAIEEKDRELEILRKLIAEIDKR